MDLKIKDVAELLNVSETTIRRWLAEGKIPAYRLNHQYRFSKIEIEDWVMSCKTKENQSRPFSEEPSSAAKEQAGTHKFSLYRAIHKGHVLENIEGNTKASVIKNAVAKIAFELSLDQDVLTELLLDREKLMPCALNHGIAVPHTRDFLLNETFDVVSIVFPQKPIDYGALDGEFVHTLFFLFACQDKRHLHLLAKIAHFSQSQENLEFLKTKPKKADLLNYIKKWETEITALTAAN